MSAFAVAAFHPTLLAVGARGVQALVWIRPAGLGDAGADVLMRVWTPEGAAVTALRAVAPDAEDLRDAGVVVDERTVEYAAGRWRDGAREYELTIALPRRAAGEEMLAARVDVIADGELAGRARIAMTWSDDLRLLAASGEDAGTGANAAAELPTGPSPRPRHTVAHDAHAGEPCPGCGVQTAEGDRFCEGCGRELVAS